MAQPRTVSLHDLVLNTDRMLRRLIGEDIELVYLPVSDLGVVRVEPGQMEQVLVNMAVNARDAMPDGGKLTIQTANVTLDLDSARGFADLAPGQYVKLSISDTGIGMDEEVKSHLFEPFFTTKEPGKGTGLGLATCYGIVKASGGDILVQSESGHGSTFDIYLPRVEEAAAQVVEEADGDEVPRGTETVLLVEDEPSVRLLAAEVLRLQGYTVLEAGDGEEAMRVAQEHGEKEIHLLLTDIIMPR
ncbi:MAG: ATP-binding protein, partial [Dehalococcoidia bacterium]